MASARSHRTPADVIYRGHTKWAANRRARAGEAAARPSPLRMAFQEPGAYAGDVGFRVPEQSRNGRRVIRPRRRSTSGKCSWSIPDLGSSADHTEILVDIDVQAFARSRARVLDDADGGHRSRSNYVRGRGDVLSRRLGNSLVRGNGALARGK